MIIGSELLVMIHFSTDLDLLRTLTEFNQRLPMDVFAGTHAMTQGHT